jgi:hypothetical protein
MHRGQKEIKSRKDGKSEGSLQLKLVNCCKFPPPPASAAQPLRKLLAMSKLRLQVALTPKRRSEAANGTEMEHVLKTSTGSLCHVVALRRALSNNSSSRNEAAQC